MALERRLLFTVVFTMLRLPMLLNMSSEQAKK